MKYTDGLRCHDTHTKFYKHWFSHSYVDGRGGGSCIHRHWQSGDGISLLSILFKVSEVADKTMSKMLLCWVLMDKSYETPMC
jgi:hypothetical protein